MLDTCKVLLNNSWIPQLLIQRKGSKAYTWEALSYIQEQFPTFDLVDKVLFDGEGNVMIKNVEGVTSKGHVEGDPCRKDNVHNFVRRSNRMRNVPARFRN